MSSVPQVSSLPKGVHLLGEACFSEDFSLERSGGQLNDVDALAVLLPTMIRSASNCGGPFDAGSFQGVLSLGNGRGIRVNIYDEKSSFQLFEGVTCWDDLKESQQEPDWTRCGFPLYRDFAYLGQVFKSLNSVKWFGLRDNEDNQWSQEFLDENVDSHSVENATMMALQVDMLLKGQELPRGRVRLDFESGHLWIWASVTDDYLMAFTGLGDDESGLRTIEQLGESFLLESLI